MNGAQLTVSITSPHQLGASADGNTVVNSMSIGGRPQTPVATTPALPRPGPAAVTYSTMTASLNPGTTALCKVPPPPK